MKETLPTKDYRVRMRPSEPKGLQPSELLEGCDDKTIETIDAASSFEFTTDSWREFTCVTEHRTVSRTRTEEHVKWMMLVTERHRAVRIERYLLIFLGSVIVIGGISCVTKIAAPAIAASAAIFIGIFSAIMLIHAASDPSRRILGRCCLYAAGGILCIEVALLISKLLHIGVMP